MTVAPFTGAWIEIMTGSPKISSMFVAPFTGAWIEMIALAMASEIDDTSHPSRVRGLKFYVCICVRFIHLVAPFTGAWIEMPC